MANHYLRKYGAAATIDFELYEADGTDLQAAAVHASGDTKIMKDEGAEANTTNGFTDEGQGYSIVLTATEMQAARIAVYIVDQTATKAWMDKVLIIETYGNASAQHAFDLDTASVAQTGDSFARLGSPAGASIAADLVAIDNFVDDLESRLTAARAGYLDELAAANIPADVDTLKIYCDKIDDATDGLTAIKAEVEGLGGAAMRGTDSAALASVCTEARLSELDAGTPGKAANVVDGIQTDLSNGTDGLGALKALIDAVQTQVDTTGVALLASAVDAIWDEVLTAAAHNVATSAGRKIRELTETIIIDQDTAQTGAATTITLAAGASAVNDFYKGMIVVLLSSTGSGQARACTGYDGGTKVATIGPAWATNPASGTEYAILSFGSVVVAALDDIDLSATMKTSINTECDTALTDYDPPTRAELTTDKNSIITEIDANETKIDALNDLSAAQVNAEVVDALNVDTYAEPGQEAPGATVSLVKKIGYLYKAWRNKKDNDGSTRNLYNDDAATVDQKSTVAEAGGTVTTGEWGSGP